jgi:redox-sensitive bicupin YhaK (pirin superfamily)
MSISRKLVHIDTPQGQPGFLGRGHVARPVIQRSFAESDPFIMLMDDMLDKKDDAPSGGPHPHAGFETVSLLIEGEMGEMKGGDFQMMTAGSGVVHTETIDRPTRMRLLQLWLNLPKKDRWAPPRLQELSIEHVPQLLEDGVKVRLYSGELAGLRSPVQNYTPMILADITLQTGAGTVQQLPANFNTFLYVLEGTVLVGEEKTALAADSVGWLDIFNSDEESQLKLEAGKEGVRLVLYSAKPTGDAIVSHGPFIGGSNEDILRLYNEYRQGKMKHISMVEEERRMVL